MEKEEMVKQVLTNASRPMGSKEISAAIRDQFSGRKLSKTEVNRIIYHKLRTRVEKDEDFRYKWKLLNGKSEKRKLEKELPASSKHPCSAQFAIPKVNALPERVWEIIEEERLRIGSPEVDLFLENIYFRLNQENELNQIS